MKRERDSNKGKHLLTELYVHVSMYIHVHAPICTLHVYMYLIFNANTCNYCILIVRKVIRTNVKYQLLVLFWELLAHAT